MAIELMARIWARPRAELDSSEKWVLTIMADRADDDGMLWYAVSTIAEKTSLTDRGVQKIMDRLITKGLVKRVHRTDRSNYYLIQVDRFPHVDRVKKPKEAGPKEFIAPLDEEPDLFTTGERRSSGTGEPGSATGERRSETGEPGSPNSLSDSLSDSLIPSEDVAQLVIDLWSELASRHVALQHAPPLSEKRRDRILERTRDGRKEFPDLGEREFWSAYFERVGNSRLLTGQKLDWAPTFDWLIGPKNFEKVLGDNYGQGIDAIGAVSKAGGDRSAVAAASDARRAVAEARQRLEHADHDSR